MRVAGVVAVERDGSVFWGDDKITASMLPSINCLGFWGYPWTILCSSESWRMGGAEVFDFED